MEGFGPLDRSSNLRRATTTIPESPSDVLIIKYLFYLRDKGFRHSTIEGNVQILKYLSKFADLLDPDSIRHVIASQKWSERRKRNAAYAYRHLLKMEGMSWDEPKYYGKSKLPFVPYEKEIDSLITSLSPTLATLTHTLKETGARISEAIQIEIKDIDTENKHDYY